MPARRGLKQAIRMQILNVSRSPRHPPVWEKCAPLALSFEEIGSTMKSPIKYVVVTAVFLGTFLSFSPDANAATTLRSAAMASANTQKGAHYVYGAAGGYSRGYDCSGLIYWSYRQHGKILPRTTGGQYNHVHHINWHYRKPGDLVFIRYGHGTPYHVGIYVGYWSGKSWMLNANSGSYRGRKVVTAPIVEYLGHGANAVYGRY